jgi:hypothetical protein
LLLSPPGDERCSTCDDDAIDDSASVHQKKIFAPVVFSLLKRHAAGELTPGDKVQIERAYNACIARDPTTSSRRSTDGATHNWYGDYHDDMEEPSLDQLLLACMHCETSDQIRKLRTHVFEHEHELIFDDVLKIIESKDEAKKLLLGLCPLKEQSGNCDDAASLDNRTTKSIAALYPKCIFLNISEFCVRTEPRKQGQPECCKSVFSARALRVRVKLLQMKMLLLHQTRGLPKVDPVPMSRLAPHPANSARRRHAKVA